MNGQHGGTNARTPSTTSSGSGSNVPATTSMRRADRNRRDRARLPFDRAWFARAALALAVAGFIFLIVKASMMTFDRGGHRLDRHERAAQDGAVQRSAGTQREKP